MMKIVATLCLALLMASDCVNGHAKAKANANANTNSNANANANANAKANVSASFHRRECPPGLDRNECDSSPCLNSATCIDGKCNYTCVCADGYTGHKCEINIDDCSGNPCKAYEMCVDGVGDYSCVCSPGTPGPGCDIRITGSLSFDNLYTLNSSCDCRNTYQAYNDVYNIFVYLYYLHDLEIWMVGSTPCVDLGGLIVPNSADLTPELATGPWMEYLGVWTENNNIVVKCAVPE